MRGEKEGRETDMGRRRRSTALATEGASEGARTATPPGGSARSSHCFLSTRMPPGKGSSSRAESRPAGFCVGWEASVPTSNFQLSMRGRARSDGRLRARSARSGSIAIPSVGRGCLSLKRGGGGERKGSQKTATNVDDERARENVRKTGEGGARQRKTGEKKSCKEASRLREGRSRGGRRGVADGDGASRLWRGRQDIRCGGAGKGPTCGKAAERRRLLSGEGRPEGGRGGSGNAAAKGCGRKDEK